MRIDRYYHIAALPALGELGSAPPMGLAELMEHVGEHSRPGKLVGALVLFDDLLQREAYLAGEIEAAEPVVLTAAEAQNDAPLPAFLDPPDEHEPWTIDSDAVWEAYFRHVAELGQQLASPFLVEWARFEVALRNALASARADRLGLEEAGYLVAKDMADDQEDFSAVLNEWAAAPSPLAGLRAVLRARWAWLDRHDAWFTFSEDELAAYAARLMLLEQWRRTTEDDEPAAAEAAPP